MLSARSRGRSQLDTSSLASGLVSRGSNGKLFRSREVSTVCLPKSLSFDLPYELIIACWMRRTLCITSLTWSLTLQPVAN